MVTRMCGGLRTIAWRSLCGVSPVRTATRIDCGASPAANAAVADLLERHLQIAVDVVAQRLQRRNVNDLRFVRQVLVDGLPKQASIDARNAASVLPEPVGAATSVCSPPTIAGQLCSWAVGRRTESLGKPCGNDRMKQ